MQVVVLGMHRSGTSATTAALNALGVHVGDNLLMRGRLNDAHYEDRDFLRLNETILHRLDGRWDNPPRIEAIERCAERYAMHIEQLIRRKNKRKLWGWKDPRTCLTISLYEPFLRDPRYIKVMREPEAVAASLVKRSGRTLEFWRKLHIHYITCVEKFLHGKSHLVVWYEDLTDKAMARDTLAAMNKYVNGNGKIADAIKKIKFNE